MKKYYMMTISMVLMLIITACGKQAPSLSDNAVAVSEDAVVSENQVDSLDGDKSSPAKVYSLSGNMVAKLSKFDQLVYFNEDTATIVTCSEGAINVRGEGAIVSENKISLVEEGTYIVRGDFPDNYFYINTGEDKKVHLVLDNANIACNSTSPIYGANGDKIIITLTDNSVNSLSDTVNHANDDGNGCLFSNTDVTINGAGKLGITGNFNSGIQVKKNLKIYGSTVNVEANNNGIRGNNSVTLVDAKITITAKGDGIKVTEDENKEKGFIFISGGVIEVTADDDVLQATNGCVIRDKADVRGRCYGSLVNCKGGYIEGEDVISRWE